MQFCIDEATIRSLIDQLNFAFEAHRADSDSDTDNADAHDSEAFKCEELISALARLLPIDPARESAASWLENELMNHRADDAGHAANAVLLSVVSRLRDPLQSA